MMSAAVETGPKFRAGVPNPLFELTNLDACDVAPDGKRFVMIRTRGDDAARSLAVVLHWFDDLKRRVSASKK
jgi:hypothetical protein